jgi:hypothetical protein
MALTDTQTRALLRHLDDPAHLKEPAGFGRGAHEARFARGQK